MKGRTNKRKVYIIAIAQCTFIYCIVYNYIVSGLPNLKTLLQIKRNNKEISNNYVCLYMMVIVNRYVN